MTIWTDALLNQLSSPLLFLLLTLSGYKTGLWLYKKSGNNTLFHPLIWSTSLVALIVILGPWSYETYKAGNGLLYTLLGPATVALAVPLERQFNTIRQLAVPILISLVIGGIAVVIIGVALAAVFGGSTIT